MSKLLHSKTFRGNLAKWFILYILALLITVGVVTYSKYISSMTSNDDARVANFKVKITKGDICSTTSPDLCNLTSYKPYDEVEYKFTVNTEKVEVLTDVILNINVNSDFKVISLNDFILPNSIEGDTLKATMSDNTELLYKNNAFTLINEAGPGKVNKKEYTLKLQFKKNNEYNKEHKYDESVYVGYSVIQKNK